MRRMTTTTGAPTAAAAPPEPARADVDPPFASWLRRVGAALLDGALLSVVAFLAADPPGARAPAWVVVYTPTSGPSAPTSVTAGAVFLLLLALQAWTGMTPGKRALGIVVVRERDGRPVGILGTGVRAVAHLADAVLMLGYLRPLWHARRRTLADSLVGSDVLLLAEHRARTSRPRPRTWLTVVTWVLCGAALPLSVPGSRGAAAETFPCDPASPDRTVPGVAGVVLDVPARTQETRLWLSRDSATAPATVTWLLGEPGPADGTELTWRVVDGTGRVTAEDSVVVHGAAPSGEDGTPAARTRTVPAGAFGKLGAPWGWTAEAVVDGEAVTVCTVEAGGAS
ncbi:RDD domain containing protein [Cellulomonas fimi ATCC 484]|uniref:RDD domain containing protein n=2 Tax=Cellulomonas fimi TaxID=1708 RepID=F4H7U8_CELFA|nr:RDD domain containing protein [Cellulomonas fimi ATCC 484]VEH30584.1 RDD family [Cellulomonas fimi]